MCLDDHLVPLELVLLHRHGVELVTVLYTLDHKDYGILQQANCSLLVGLNLLDKANSVGKPATSTQGLWRQFVAAERVVYLRLKHYCSKCLAY